MISSVTFSSYVMFICGQLFFWCWCMDVQWMWFRIWFHGIRLIELWLRGCSGNIQIKTSRLRSDGSLIRMRIKETDILGNTLFFFTDRLLHTGAFKKQYLYVNIFCQTFVFVIPTFYKECKYYVAKKGTSGFFWAISIRLSFRLMNKGINQSHCAEQTY